MERNEKETIEKLMLSIITMKFSRFITVVIFFICDHLNNNSKDRNSWTAKIEVKHYNCLSVPLESRLIEKLFTQLHRTVTSIILIS